MEMRRRELDALEVFSCAQVICDRGNYPKLNQSLSHVACVIAESVDYI